MKVVVLCLLTDLWNLRTMDQATQGTQETTAAPGTESQETQETTAASAIEIQETTAAPAGIIVKKTLPQIYVLVSNEAS